MFAQGEIQTGVRSQAIVVPVQVVYRDDRSAKSAYVFVVDNGRAARRDVGIGREREQLLEITSGLKAGDTLITEQSLEIASGVRIAPRK
jgi:multidrug efflux pump subunit AcrA (membrane-fusion protein)